MPPVPEEPQLQTQQYLPGIEKLDISTSSSSADIPFCYHLCLIIMQLLARPWLSYHLPPLLPSPVPLSPLLIKHGLDAISVLLFPLLIISRELPLAAPPASGLTFPGMKQSTNVRRLSARSSVKRPLQLTPISQTEGKKVENLVGKAAKGRDQKSILSEWLLPCSEQTVCPCITEACLAPRICYDPTHFLPYFMEMVELFNLHIDWQKEILGA